MKAFITTQSQTDRYTYVIRWLIKIMILLIPLININEISWALGLSDFTSRGGMFLIKYIKDAGMFGIIILSILKTTNRKTLPKTYAFLPFITIYLCLITIYNIEQPTTVLLCGFRWFLPLILFIFLSENINYKFMKELHGIMLIVFLIHFSAQIYELFYMLPYNGSTYFGLTARVPGIFSHAHSSASFTCLFFLITDEVVNNKKKKALLTILISISLIFSMSSTGIIIFLTLFLYASFKNSKHILKLFLILPIIILLFYNNADTLTNRGKGSSERSLATRKELFINIFEESNIISNKFGLATNAVAMTNIVSVEKRVHSDSFYATFLGNLGLFPFMILIIGILYALCIFFVEKKTFTLSCILLYLLFSFSTVITEVYPMNLFIGILIAFHLNNKKIKNQYEYCRITNLLQQKRKDSKLFRVTVQNITKL